MSNMDYSREQMSSVANPKNRAEKSLFAKQISWLSRDPKWRYGIAIVLPAVALILAYLFLIYLSREHSPFIFLLVTVFIVSLLCGAIPGVISHALYLGGAIYFLSAPISDFSVHQMGDLVRILDHFFFGLLMIWVGSKGRKNVFGMSAARNLYEVTIEAAADGLLVVGRDGRVSHFNHNFSQMWGLSEELVSSHDKDWLITHVSERLKDPKQYLDKVADIYAHTETSSYDVLRFKDGKVFERITRPYELEGQYSGRVTSFRDITRFEEAKEVMAQALRVRDDFISITAHELRTPLTALKMQIQLLHRLLSDEMIARNPRAEQLTKGLLGSEKQLEQFVKLVDDLLNVSRMGTGKLSLAAKNVDLSEAVRELLARYQAKWAESHCEIKFSSAPSVCGQWDPLRLEEVVVNLLTNATKYGAGKPVEITVQQVGDNARLTVLDHGIGIAKEDRERIFVRFERATTAKSFRGFGLGLFITRQIVEAHGGRIWVESKLGAGSAFIVELPLRQPDTKQDTLSVSTST